MGFILTEKIYIEYIKRIAKKIAKEKDYISELDAATGDGDHWVNLNLGFTALLENIEELSILNFPDMFRKIGTILMNVVGGSSGILYGSAYLAMGRTVKSYDLITRDNLVLLLDSMMQAIMKRGNSQPGQKTMIDTLDVAITTYYKALEENVDDRALLNKLIEGAKAGAESTRPMEAFRGRACYQMNKGVGHLDPGAVTMSYQIETLAQEILQNI